VAIDQTASIDLATIDHASGDLWLSISDHLPWGEDDDGPHLLLLQEKLNAYLRFIESGEVIERIPEASDRNVVINLVGKFSLSPRAEAFFQIACAAIAEAGFRLQFTLLQPN
jgi:hypothetical protein